MTLEMRSQADRLEEIRALRRRLIELESDAGLVPPPGLKLDPDTIRQSIAVLRGLMETLLVGFAIGNSKGKIVDANEAFANLLGYSRLELLDARLSWKRLTPPEYAEIDRVSQEEMQRTGLPFSYRKEYIRRDGSRVPVVIVVIHTTSERDEHGVFVLDDSMRQTAEADLRRTETTYHQILDAIPDLLLLREADSRIVWANRAFLEFHDTTQEALTGAFAPPGRPAEALESELRDHALVLETGMSVDLPQQALARADGTLRIFHTVKSPVMDPGGHFVRTVSVSRDVTDRTRAERALLRSEANLRTAQALANIGSYQMSVPYRDDDYWSEQIGHIVGLPTSGVTLTTEEFIQRLVPSDHAALVSTAVDAAILEGRPFDITYPIVRPDGCARWVRSIGAPFRDAQGNVDGIVGTLIDVTEQREAEAAREKLDASLRQAQKLEAVGTLARGIAHDFNNILGALSGYAELAFESTRDNPRVHGDLQHVLEAAQRASALVTRLLVFSRQQERGQASLRLEPAVRDSLHLLRSTLPPNVEIRETLAAGAPEILGDETQLLQVVMNLATNALHAMRSRGGVLGIGLEPLRVDASFARRHPDLRPGPYALLTVSDTGHGIEPHVLERVLEPFFTTKPPGEGTGLGLSVVHGIVREYEGALEIESVPGEGTTVRVYLPAASERGDEGIALRSAPPRGSGQRVLLVDDERALADLGQRRLEQLGYVPSVFTDSRRALEAFRQRPHDFDLVVTDQAMPNLTGIELAREIRRIRPELPVVLVSGYGDTLRPEGLEAAGIRRFLSKPVTEAALAEAVFTALDSRPG